LMVPDWIRCLSDNDVRVCVLLCCLWIGCLFSVNYEISRMKEFFLGFYT
jgi:hypothetical protein